MTDNTKREIEITSRTSELYREIIPDGVWGYIRPGYLSSTFITNQSDVFTEIDSNGKRQKTERVAEINIKFTPQLAKQFAVFLLERIILYEESYGVIITDVDLSKLKIPNDVKSKVDEILEKARAESRVK